MYIVFIDKVMSLLIRIDKLRRYIYNTYYIKSGGNMKIKEKSEIFKRINKVLISLGTMVYMFLGTSAPAFADDLDQITSSVNTGLGKVYGIMSAVVLPIAAVYLAYSAFKIFTAGSRSAEEAVGMFIRVFIVLGLIYLAPLIVVTIKGWFSNISSTTNVFG